MSAVALIIPCYNEAERLKTSEFLSFVETNKDYTLYFVDDGSNDATFEVLSELRAKNNEQIKIIRNVENLGKGESVRKAMLEAYSTSKFEQIGFLDADLSTPLNEFIALTNFLKENHKKAVFGSRLKMVGTHIERSPFRHIIGRFFATLISWTIKMPFYDTQCGAKVFKAETIEEICQKPFVSRWLFDVEIILRLKRKYGEHIFDVLHEYPLQSWQQVDGSKITLIDGLKIPFELVKIKRKNT